MSQAIMSRSVHQAVLIALAATLALPAAPAVADPPPWAPAHGWRKKNDPNYVGYTGHKWDQDYGIVEGHCDWQAVGAVVGTVVGGVIGSKVGKGDGKVVATVVGAVLGGAIGAKIGRDADAADRACVGHALELSGDRQRVTWSNPQTGVNYLLTPLRGYKQDNTPCREFNLQVTANGQQQSSRRTACQAGDGTWKIAG